MKDESDFDQPYKGRKEWRDKLDAWLKKNGDKFLSISEKQRLRKKGLLKLKKKRSDFDALRTPVKPRRKS